MTLRRPHRVQLLILIIAMTGCAPTQSYTPPTATTNLTPTAPAPTVVTLTTTMIPTPSTTPTVQAASTPLVSDTALVFVNETIPDGTNFQPGQAFQKTWTIENGGSTAWDKDFALKRISSSPTNESLGSPDEIPLSKEVKPGETIQIGVDLVAPTQNGGYTVFYQLQDANGSLISHSQIWVSISVGTVIVAGSSGIKAQLQNASMQGEEFTVGFCMQLPDERAWYPWDVVLDIDQQQYTPSGGRTDPIGATTANKCFYFSYPITIPSGSHYRLSIGKVELPAEIHQAENCAYAQSTLRETHPGLDFTCTGPGLWYTNLILPAGMTEEQADKLILDAMSNAIYGPWVLEGNAP